MWQPATITRDESNQTVSVNSIPCHVKHIKPGNDTRSLCIISEVEIDTSTDICHENAENHE